jgi:hypothetical protein
MHSARLPTRGPLGGAHKTLSIRQWFYPPWRDTSPLSDKELSALPAKFPKGYPGLMKTWGCGFKLLHPGLDALVVTSIIFKTLRQAQQNQDEPISAVKSKFSSGQGYPHRNGSQPSFDLRPKDRPRLFLRAPLCSTYHKLKLIPRREDDPHVAHPGFPQEFL